MGCPRIYLSGALSKKGELSEVEFLDRTGVKFRCHSYVYSAESGLFYKKQLREAMDYCIKSKRAGIMFDSGAHSFHNLLLKESSKSKHAKDLNPAERKANVEKLVEGFVDSYCKWLKGYGANKFDFYFTFDYEKVCNTIWNVTAKMRKAGLMPVPVYHGDSSLDYIRKYADEGHTLIGLGIIRSIGLGPRDGLRHYYSRVFNLGEKLGLRFHGLAMTGTLMLSYPWWSVDSTSWLKLAAYGKVIIWEANRRAWNEIHVSNTFAGKAGRDSFKTVSDISMKGFRDLVESRGFDFDKMRKSMYERALYNAWVTANEIQQKESNANKWTKLL